MNQEYLKILAQKFLDGTASEEEKQLLHSWYDKTTLSGESEIVVSENYETEEQLKQSILGRLKDSIAQNEAEQEPVSSGLFRRLGIWAASAAAVITLAIFAWHKTRPASESVMQLVHAPFGQTISIQLSDGSKLWLNSGSTVRFPKIFTQKLREITLVNGQAFFDVVHESKRPFVVRTKTLDVTVLGTSFDVKAYDNDGQSKVTVKSGKVGVSLHNQPGKPAVMLLPEKQIIVQNKKSEIKISEISPPAIAPWKDNRNVLEDEPLSEVFHALERKYNQHIVVEKKALEEEKISITLDNQPLTDVLKVLSFSKKFNYSQLNDSTIVIR
ncbi:FecR family protein [Dyadobacter subterraneus]|uniref:FecR domain-containing protein n=1 Tax=Dyadobacter subterraneus TaxID=2773304 RepID=A0ABR9W9Q5_9BACT|nr:FecR domain-containing protein [Dyadobacter subterraneus]MBE9462218.1 FecR domain-containing protein [Dyadobacter subterraneus]